MIEALFSIALAIVWIVVGTSLFKLHPFLVLFSAALALPFLLGIPAMESLLLLQKGFGNLIQNIGLLILFGTIIGVALEKSKATLAIA
ncbi:MAG: GntP family permease, partial [Flavobacteriaceae bacterium]